jgi:protein-S-isoprenylcysteine O-methyltransferase Ste14
LHTISGAGVSFVFLGTASFLLSMGGAAVDPTIHTIGCVAALIALWHSITAWRRCRLRSSARTGCATPLTSAWRLLPNY